MSWSYSQSKATISHNGQVIGTGYSGNGAGLNNPALQNDPDVGPIPQGTYTIGPPFTHPDKGPIVMRLRQAPGNQMFARDGFMIHGDNQAMNHTASEGCIILARTIRVQIAGSGDPSLIVTS
jgi:Tlde1 domain